MAKLTTNWDYDKKYINDLKKVTEIDVTYSPWDEENLAENLKVWRSGTTLYIKVAGDRVRTYKNFKSTINIKVHRPNDEAVSFNNTLAEFYNTFNTFYYDDKKYTLTGTTGDDIINVSTPRYAGTKQKGYTINAGKGNDTITGTQYSDTITGGAGTNTVQYSAQNFGDDIIKLTKGETLNITGLDFDGIEEKDKYTVKGSDLYITSKYGHVTVKNYAMKSTGAVVKIDGNDLTTTPKIYLDKTNISKAVITGTNLSDSIDATGAEQQYKTVKKKKVATNLVINGGAGNDTITGSELKDTINGGAGNDTIIGSGGADQITGGAGLNTYKYTELSQLDGDRIILTKGENAKIDLTALDTTATYEVVGKNLEVTANGHKFTIMNFGTNNVTNNKTKKMADSSSVILIDNTGEVDLRAVAEVKSNSGTFHNDNIDRHSYYNRKNKGLTINGGAGNDTIIGTDYSDTIKAGTGLTEEITGGHGNDKLYASVTANSNTTFIFNPGDGKDAVYSGKGSDTLKFDGEGLAFSTSVSKNKKDLTINYTESDSVTIKDYYSVSKKGKITGINPKNSIKNVNIGGHLIDIETIKECAENGIIISPNSITGTTGNDIIIGTGTTIQNIYGNGGNDIVYCTNDNYSYVTLGNGDDIVYGGNYQTNSYGILDTGNGNNTVYFGNSHMYTTLGEGNDTLYHKGFQDIWFTGNNGSTGITNGGHDTVYYDGIADGYYRFYKTVYDDMVFTRAEGSDDLEIRYGEDNSVTLKDYYKSGNENFGNITMYTLKEAGSNEKVGRRIKNALSEKGGAKQIVEGLTGTDGNDYIAGTDEAETIDAKAGNDLINSKGGDDNIILGAGDDILVAGSGNKTINAVSGNNTINLGSGANTVTLGTGSDKINSGTGNNTFTFIENDTGNDTYTYGGGTDTLYFSANNESDLVVDTRGDNLLMTVGNATTLTLNNCNRNSNITVKAQDDSNGRSLMNLRTIAGISASTENQTITTGNHRDVIYSGLGDDTISAGEGDNRIHLYIAESGNNNTFTSTKQGYNFLLIHGLDDLDGLRFMQLEQDLVIAYNDGDFTNNTLTLSGYYSGDVTDNFSVKAVDTDFSADLSNLMTPEKVTQTFICDGEHLVDASERVSGVNIIGCEETDNITGSPYNDIINGKGGADIINGGAGNDLYTIDSADWNTAQATITDTAGENDTLKINTASDKINLFFDVELTKDGDEVVFQDNLPVYSTGNDLFITSHKYNLDSESIGSNGVKITNYFTTGKIENIYRQENNSIYSIYENKIIKAVGQSVAIWLNNNGFDSTQDVITNGTEEEKTALLRMYRPTVSTGNISGTNKDDVLVGVGTTIQNIYGGGGNDIVYCTNDNYSYVTLGNGDDIVYGGNYQTNSYGILDTGNGNNTVYFGNTHMYTTLGEGNDTLYHKGFQDIWFTGNNGSTGITNGGHDTVYYDGIADGYYRFYKTVYDDMGYTRPDGTDDLIINYGEDNSVTLKDFYKSGNENFGNMTMYTLKEAESNQKISHRIGNAVLENGGAGDDIYNSVNIDSHIVINDNGGTDVLNIYRNKEQTYIIFNVKKDGTFAQGDDKLLLTTQTDFNEWKASGTNPSYSLTINDFDSIETIKSNDGYYTDTAKLNALKSDVAGWLSSANGGEGYADVATALTSGDADLPTLVAMFSRDANWATV